MKIHILGYASDIAANRRGAADGPVVMKASEPFNQLPIQWDAILTTDANESGLAAMSVVKTISEKLASHTESLSEQQKPFLTIGGDHSCAIGTWSGASNAFNNQLGLIWIDAHMDAHTPESSHTKNIHGMPIATLLGHGMDALTQIGSDAKKLAPENLVLIGIRSFDTPEAELLKQLNVRVYTMDEIKERGLTIILEEATAIVSKNTRGFGVSIDLDGIDPKDAPGVSLQAIDGIRAADLLDDLSPIAKNPNFIGAEIAEFCPRKDVDQKTEILIAELTKALFDL